VLDPGHQQQEVQLAAAVVAGKPVVEAAWARIQQVVRHIREAALRTAAEEDSLVGVGRKASVVAVKAEQREQAPAWTVG
jgi:hypothetical protein